MIAFVIGVPVAWYLMNNWLNNFTFKVPVGIGVFLVTIVSSIAIAWTTVGYKAVKAAMANPVKSLSAE